MNGRERTRLRKARENGYLDVFRAAIRPQNYERNEERVEERKTGKVLRMASA
jgi:hypothetical protein